MTNFLRKFRQIFALPKWAKIFLAVLSVIALLGLGFNAALQIWAKDKEFSANLVFHGLETWKTERLREAKKQNLHKNAATPSLRGDLSPKFTSVNCKTGDFAADAFCDDAEFAYKVKAEFTSLKALLRSRTISHIEVVQIAWVEAINPAQIHGVESANRYISFITTQNLHDNANLTTAKSLGVLTYKIDFTPFLKTISKYYILIVLVVFVPFILRRIYKILWQELQKFPQKIQPNLALNSSLNLAPNLSKFDKGFLIFAFLLCGLICVFTFWLGFPGYLHDGDISSAYSLGKSNWHPVFEPYVLEFLFAVFGRHTFYAFLFNLVPFYAGIFFIIAAFYIRTRSKFTLLLLFPTFIGNLYLGNFIQMSYLALGNFCFCFYAMILFWILGREFIGKKAAKALWIGVFVLMFFAILWRHNAIFSVFPAFFIIVYLFLQNRNLSGKVFAKFYAKFIILSAILCLFVVIFVPKILAHGESHPSNHVFYLQIAATCVPADDSTCIPKEWYKESKTWDDAKDTYRKNPLHGDFLYEVFHGNPPKIKSVWLKSITKHPANFLKHEATMLKTMWLQSPRDDDVDGFSRSVVKAANTIQNSRHPGWVGLDKTFPENERGISFSPTQEKIYSFFYENLPVLNHIVGVSIAGLLLVISSILWILSFKANSVFVSQRNLLLFVFSVSFAAFFSAFFIAAFTMVTWSRYMSPILYLSIIAFVGFVAFLCEISKKLEFKFSLILFNN